MLRNPKLLKVIALFFLIQFTTQLFLPTVTFALTSGPSQPEFSSFQPVTASNMVSEFTGDFTYNLPILEVPGPQGSGYPLSLSYQSGVTPEEEASWVGFGWTLNAGAINRNLRGLPDDYNKQQVKFHNRMPKNWTASVGAGFSFGEVFGKDLKGIIGGSLNGSIRYNNYRGFGYNAGLGISLGRGLVSMGYNVSDGSGSYSLNVNPYVILNAVLQSGTKYDEKVKAYKDDKKISDDDWNADDSKERAKWQSYNKSFGSAVNLMGSTYGMFSYTQASKPNIVTGYSGKSFNVSVGAQTNPGPIPVGGTVNLYGSYTYQTNTPVVSTDAFGYMYSSEATSDDMMDYHVESEKDFNPRDIFLGIPFNDADNFTVSGEGIGGGFRLYNKKAGHFGPRHQESKIDIVNVAAELAVGWTFGGGADIGLGISKLNVEDWKRDLSSFESALSTTVDEPVFFRFNNDLGGEWGTTHDDKPIQASLSGTSISVKENYKTYSADSKRNARSSYIGYHTNAQMLDGANPSRSAYSRIVELNTLSDRSNNSRTDLIGELSVFNEAGSQYIYGLPVFNRNELSLSYSARGTSVQQNYMAYTNTLNEDIKVGEERNQDYAATYLLTEILTPNYVDLGTASSNGEHGSSPDDLGGYTRFNYKKETTSGDFFKWRAPYKGLLYSKNSHSDNTDDMATMSSGEKEIYYLHTLETKTHVAVFYTSDRLDGLEAPDANAQRETAAAGDRRLKKLDKIELYAIADFLREGSGILDRETWGSPKLNTGGSVKPIKTVHFVYDNSQNSNLPNALGNVGKLTLKRVYFEYNGVAKATISPYEFSYQYPNYTTYPAKYKTSGLDDVSVGFKDLTPVQQNPAYDFFLSDAWGNYQSGGQSRFAEMRSWVDQTTKQNQNIAGGFDPAAWHLKRIILPSGGEIHIQYEQDDYSYVQDQAAHVMVGLKAGPGGTPSNRYYLDLPTANIPTTELTQLKKMIDERYVSGGKKMFFKILYSLVNNVAPTLSTCNAEFITGYASIQSCTISGTDIYVDFVASQRLPVEVCKDFVKAQRLGKVFSGQDCSSSGMNDGSDAKAVVKQLLSLAENLIVPGDNNLCQQIDRSHSYLRIPTPLAKKGGGLRVKRLMMFDKGIETGAVLYGSEYIYQTRENGRLISSGVATNEPGTIREENILTDFVARKGQNLWSKIVAGRDQEKAEGPLGESVLPGPSVGYSKVIVKSIHSGISNPGFSISEFYTAKDYPVTLAHPDKIGTMTTIKAPRPQQKSFTSPFHSEVKNKSWATQGFSFVLNSMHGQVKSNTAYSGPYSDIYDLSKSIVVSRTAYEYFKPGEKIPMISSLFGSVAMKNPGREVDITFSQRRVKEKQKDVNTEVDLEITVIPLLFVVLVIPFPTAIPAFSDVEGELSTHSTSKVVRYPAILKKIEIFNNGIVHTEENLAFDDYTGKPVAIRTSDEFKGAYLTQSIPASWEYPNFTSKALGEGKVIIPQSGQLFTYQTVSTSEGKLTFNQEACGVLAQLVTGDMIQLTGSNGNHLYHVKSIDYLNDAAELVRADNLSTNPSDITAIKTVVSGRNNRLGENAGSITFHTTSANSLSPATMSLPESQRWVTPQQATNNINAASDGSLFIKNLNEAYTAHVGGGSIPVLAGPYYHMNIQQYLDHAPVTGCEIDLSDASIRNVQLIFIEENGSTKIRLGSLEVQCNSTWETISPETLN